MTLLGEFMFLCFATSWYIGLMDIIAYVDAGTCKVSNCLPRILELIFSIDMYGKLPYTREIGVMTLYLFFFKLIKESCTTFTCRVKFLDNWLLALLIKEMLILNNLGVLREHIGQFTMFNGLSLRCFSLLLAFFLF